MQGLSRSIIGLCRRRSVGTVGSAPSRWWPPALASRDASLMFSASAHSNRHPDRLSRFFCTTSCNKEKQSKPHSCVPSTSTTKCLDAANTRKKLANAKKLANEVTDVWFPSIISNSSRRDGAIYKNMALKEDWGDIKDRSETLLEPMMFSKPIQRFQETCCNVSHRGWPSVPSTMTPYSCMGT